KKNIKDNLLRAAEEFDLDIDNLPNLLGMSSKKINAILNDEPCILSEEENHLLNHRSFFLAEGITMLSPQERMEVIIKSTLMGECKLSAKSLAKYANVPLQVFEDFLDTDKEIDGKYLGNIYFNLYMLLVTLYTDAKENR
ncbi:MAG: HTH domain-containing protein, partial [Turicibacter sp.]